MGGLVWNLCRADDRYINPLKFCPIRSWLQAWRSAFPGKQSHLSGAEDASGCALGMAGIPRIFLERNRYAATAREEFG